MLSAQTTKIKPFIAAEKVILDLVPGDRRQILAQLVAPLVADGHVTDADLFLADLERRESQMTTVMDNGLVAIPHARSHAVRRLGLCVATAAAPGLRFDADSQHFTRVFFCLAVPSFAPTAHIPLLQSLARFARDPERIEKLLASRTPGVAARYLAQFRG